MPNFVPPIEERHEDVLQNMEAAIVAVYRENREIFDIDAMRAVEALLAHYRRAAANIPAKPLGLSGARETIALRVIAVLDERLAAIAEGANLSEVAEGPYEVYVRACRRILKSIEIWKLKGRRGYLDYISQFV